MTTLRSTVIAKTDICDFTARVKSLSESELSALLERHRAFISDIVAKNAGSIVKGEGDSFWIVFPSVTTAALAAVEMQQELRMMQTGQSDAERLAIRVAITLGDVLHQDRDIFGDTVNLTARIESVTPRDEIYLSHAAWLALNKAEVETAYVNEFALKGIKEPARVYKIEQRHKTRVVKDQVIVMTDVSGFLGFCDSHTLREIEDLLVFLDGLVKAVCEENWGVIRLIMGDRYFLTFEDVIHALAAMERFCRQWNDFVGQNHIACGQRIGVHRGDFNIFRTCIYGEDINTAAELDSYTLERERAVVLTSKKVRDEVAGTNWEQRLHRVEEDTIPPKALGTFRDLVETIGVYRLMVN